jgi:hypothetical protein
MSSNLISVTVYIYINSRIDIKLDLLSVMDQNFVERLLRPKKKLVFSR